MTAFWISFGISVTLTGFLVPVLRRLGLHDVPNERSLHQEPTPRGGGIAVVLAVCLATLAYQGEAEGLRLILAATLVLATVGLIDDVHSLLPVVRLSAQGISALAVSVTVVQLVGDDALWAPAFVVVATMATVAYVNAFNFMDGVNGISALNAAVCGAWLAWLGHDYGVPALLPVGFALVGAALGFLPWNASSRIFLGDVGSYGIGALVATSCVLAWGGGVPWLLVSAPVLVYLADTGWVILKRARTGQRLTQAHRDHVYQRLVLTGWAPWAAAALTAALAAVICVLAATLYQDQPLATVLLVLLVVLTYLATPQLTARAARADSGVS